MDSQNKLPFTYQIVAFILAEFFLKGNSLIDGSKSN